MVTGVGSLAFRSAIRLTSDPPSPAAAASASADGAYSLGQSIQLSVRFDAPVSLLSGAPYLRVRSAVGALDGPTLGAGAAERWASYAPAASAPSRLLDDSDCTLNFMYRVRCRRRRRRRRDRSSCSAGQPGG